MSKIYIYSTLTNDHKYTTWQNNSARSAPNVVIHAVLIKGGANNATRNLITPKGVVTEVSEIDHEHLMNNTHFKKHLAAGLVSVRQESLDPEKVAASGMAPKDGSAPLTPSDERFLRPGSPIPEEKKPAGIVERVRGMIG